MSDARATHTQRLGNEAQLSLVADLVASRPAFFVWVMQRFYYGADHPSKPQDQKESLAETLASSVNVAAADRTRDGWWLAARNAASSPRSRPCDLARWPREPVVRR